MVKIFVGLFTPICICVNVLGVNVAIADHKCYYVDESMSIQTEEEEKIQKSVFFDPFCRGTFPDVTLDHTTHIKRKCYCTGNEVHKKEANRFDCLKHCLHDGACLHNGQPSKCVKNTLKCDCSNYQHPIAPKINFYDGTRCENMILIRECQQIHVTGFKGKDCKGNAVDNTCVWTHQDGTQYLCQKPIRHKNGIRINAKNCKEERDISYINKTSDTMNETSENFYKVNKSSNTMNENKKDLFKGQPNSFAACAPSWNVKVVCFLILTWKKIA